MKQYQRGEGAVWILISIVAVGMMFIASIYGTKERIDQADALAGRTPDESVSMASNAIAAAKRPPVGVLPEGIFHSATIDAGDQVSINRAVLILPGQKYQATLDVYSGDKLQISRNVHGDFSVVGQLVTFTPDKASAFPGVMGGRYSFTLQRGASGFSLSDGASVVSFEGGRALTPAETTEKHWQEVSERVQNDPGLAQMKAFKSDHPLLTGILGAFLGCLVLLALARAALHSGMFNGR